MERTRGHQLRPLLGGRRQPLPLPRARGRSSHRHRRGSLRRGAKDRRRPATDDVNRDRDGRPRNACSRRRQAVQDTQRNAWPQQLGSASALHRSDARQL